MAQINLTQCFYIDKTSYPNGLFVSSIETFFQTKDSELPVILKLGNVINDEPNESDVFNYGTVTLYPNNINISSDGTTGTKFTFSTPIFLSPDKTYFFSLKSNSDQYNVYTAVEGENSFGTTNRITSHPFTGDFFLPSLNDYNLSNDEDLKFVINRCVFNSSGSLYLSNDYYSVDSEDPDYESHYNEFFVHEDNDLTPLTSVKFYYKKTTNGDILDTNYTEFTPDTNVKVSSECKLRPDSFFMKIDLETENDATTPVFDTNRLNGLFVLNQVNNDSTGETSTFGGNAKSKYITKMVELLPDIDATDLTAYALLKLPAGSDVKVYYKAAPAGVNIVTDVSYVEMERTPLGTPSTNSFVEYKFTTPTAFVSNDVNYALPDQSVISRFLFKIVLLSSNTTDLPLVKDFRGIALLD